MAHPKKKTTKRKQGLRRSHLALKRTSSTTCSHCKAATRPHAACTNCGWYKGQQVLEVRTVEERKRKREKKDKDKGKEKDEDKKKS